ncbi:topoisomerase C-terminal repeat-containing protein [Rhinopithecimicrobium faecis]|uniref:topoisomerase C-terminal repeat-containing protein n=1 Tax=Rhinopithecimicrobium faecis TaxID=2820698 RepID=UPI003365A355
MSIANEKHPELTCPKCKTTNLLIREKVVKCPNESCNWLQFRNICGVHLGLSEIDDLVKKWETNLIKGMKSKAGKKGQCRFIIGELFKPIYAYF